MKSFTNIGLLIVLICIPLLLLVLWYLSPASSTEMPLDRPGDSGGTECNFQRVSRVIDGDTFDTGENQRIRLIGVDTPETSDPRRPVEWFAREASKKLKQWIDDETVCLRRDRDRTQDTDKYGRLLRYVWKDGNGGREAFFVNAELIKQGYGFAYTRFPFQFLEDFRRFERSARENGRGLWNRDKQAAWEQEYEHNKRLAEKCGQDKTICPENARDSLGEKRTVRFFVEKTHNSGRAVFLNSEKDYRDPENFTAVIFQADTDNFPRYPEDIYWGKTVDVSGRIKEYSGRAEIILRDNSQIVILQ